MSAFGYKRTFLRTENYVRFTPESRHYAVRLRAGAAIDHPMLEPVKSWVEENRSTPSPHTYPNDEHEVPFDEEVVIKIEIIRHTVVFACKAFDRVDIVPEAQHIEMSNVAFNPVHHPSATIAINSAIAWERDSAHLLKVGIALRHWNSPMPYAANHSDTP